jgi:hypothetical protein
MFVQNRSQPILDQRSQGAPLGRSLPPHAVEKICRKTDGGALVVICADIRCEGCTSIKSSATGTHDLAAALASAPW